MVWCYACQVFWLPPDSEEKVSLSITVLLAFSVFQFVVTDLTPSSSDSTPIIGWFDNTILRLKSHYFSLLLILFFSVALKFYFLFFYVDFHWLLWRTYVLLYCNRRTINPIMMMMMTMTMKTTTMIKIIIRALRKCRPPARRNCGNMPYLAMLKCIQLTGWLKKVSCWHSTTAYFFWATLYLFIVG